MKAARLVAPRRFEIEEVEVPQPGAGEVRVRVAGCGVCGSNMPAWRGMDGMSYPLEAGAPGHEAWGRVDAVGRGVNGAAVGEAVTLLSYHALAEYDTAPVDQVVRLPVALAESIVPGQPVACAVNVAERSAVAEGDVVVVLGTGFLGALLLPLLRQRKPRRLLAVSRRAVGRAMADRMGADESLTYEEVRSRVDALTGARGADVVIEATGEARPLEIGSELCRDRGRLVVAGYHQDGRRCIDMRLWNRKGLDVINAHEPEPGRHVSAMRRGIDLICRGELDLQPLITHSVPLDVIGEVFEVGDRHGDEFFKAVVLPPAGH